MPRRLAGRQLVPACQAGQTLPEAYQAAQPHRKALITHSCCTAGTTWLSSSKEPAARYFLLLPNWIPDAGDPSSKAQCRQVHMRALCAGHLLPGSGLPLSYCLYSSRCPLTFQVVPVRQVIESEVYQAVVDTGRSTSQLNKARRTA